MRKVKGVTAKKLKKVSGADAPWRASPRQSAAKSAATNLDKSGIWNLCNTLFATVFCRNRRLWRDSFSETPPIGMWQGRPCHIVSAPRQQSGSLTVEATSLMPWQQNGGRAVSMKPPIAAASSMPPYHIISEAITPRLPVAEAMHTSNAKQSNNLPSQHPCTQSRKNDKIHSVDIKMTAWRHI